MDEKELYQISDRYGDKSFPIDFSDLPEEVALAVDELDGDYGYVYEVLSYSPKSGLDWKDVVYFRKVKKFRKGLNQYEVKDSNIIWGV